MPTPTTCLESKGKDTWNWGILKDLPISMVNTATRKIQPASEGGNRMATILQIIRLDSLTKIWSYGQKKGAIPITLEVVGWTMKIRVTVRTIQQRVNVFHIRLDRKAGLRDEKYEDTLLLLLLVPDFIVKWSSKRRGACSTLKRPVLSWPRDRRQQTIRPVQSCLRVYDVYARYADQIWDSGKIMCLIHLAERSIKGSGNFKCLL